MFNESNPRILCVGGAGSGKTLIAVEAARRLAGPAFQVLLLCFNHNLSRFLRRELRAMNSNILVTTAYRFLMDTIQSAGLGIQLSTAQAESRTDDFFKRIVPDLFESAALILADQGRSPNISFWC